MEHMTLTTKRRAMVAIVITATVIAILAIIAVSLIPANSEAATLGRTTEFLSSVVGLDMTKYSYVQPSPPPGYENRTIPAPVVSNPADVDGLLKVQAPSYDFESSEGNLHTMSTFYNGHLTFVTISSQENYIYSGSPPTDTLNQAKNLLRRYQTFLSQKCGIDGSFLVPMQNILNSVTDLSPTSVTIDNINFQVSIEGKTRLQWIYTENGTVMDRKRVDMSFRSNALVSFTDTWSFYKVSRLSVISSEEATSIAREAAQEVEWRVGHADGTTETVKAPDLANATYDVNFMMLPYRGLQPDEFPSKLPRDCETLYPYWQFHFYFGEKIGGAIGVQVGVWGDTKEIIYASSYVVHDYP
jgi:hypothetical protein